MSEGQSPTAALTELTETYEPTSQDVELVHRIVLRAQEHPLDNDRLGLLAAYDAVFSENGLDPEQDKICYWLLFEILKPGVHGDTLYEKFEDVLRRKGIVLDYTEDVPKSQDVAPTTTIHGALARSHSVQTSQSSRGPPQIRPGLMPGIDHVHRHLADLEDAMDAASASPHVVQMMRKAISIDQQRLQHQSLQMFQDHTWRNVAALERASINIYETKLKYKVFTHWYNVQRQASLNYTRADDFYVRHKATRSFATLFDSARVNRMQAMDEQRLRGLGLYKLTIAARESVFCRVLEFKLTQKCMHKLATSLQVNLGQVDALEALLRQNQLRLNNRYAARALSYMDEVAREQHHRTDIATRQYEGTLVRRLWPRLRETHRQIGEMKAVAAEMRQFYLMQKYFRKMYWISQEKRARRLILGRRCIRRWQNFVKRQKEQRYQALYKDFRRDHKIRLARRCWQKMEQKHYDVQSIEQTADERQKLKTDGFAHGVIVSWYNRAHEVIRADIEASSWAGRRTLEHFLTILSDRQQYLDQLSQQVDKADDYFDRRRVDRCLRQMNRKTFEIQRRRQDADAFRTRHDRQTLKSILHQLRQGAKNSRGEPPLILPPVTPAQRRAEQLHQLASTTPLVPPRTSFAARLRGEPVTLEAINDEEWENG